jgi:hypothetical protein
LEDHPGTDEADTGDDPGNGLGRRMLGHRRDCGSRGTDERERPIPSGRSAYAPFEAEDVAKGEADRYATEEYQVSVGHEFRLCPLSSGEVEVGHPDPLDASGGLSPPPGRRCAPPCWRQWTAGGRLRVAPVRSSG